MGFAARNVNRGEPPARPYARQTVGFANRNNGGARVDTALRQGAAPRRHRRSRMGLAAAEGETSLAPTDAILAGLRVEVCRSQIKQERIACPLTH